MRECSRSLAGRTALVTGVSRPQGIGMAVARALGAAGADLFVSYYRPYDRGQPWGLPEGEPEGSLNELRRSQVRVESMEIDLADPGAAARLLAVATERSGPPDVLVNNAACSEPGGVEELDAAQLDRHYAVNLRATALLSVEFVRRLPAGRPGWIVNLTSGQGREAMPGELAYAATKGAVDALTRSLDASLTSREITVLAFDPGATDTGWMDEATRERLLAEGRIASPTDVARRIRSLVSEPQPGLGGCVVRMGDGV